MKKWEMENEKMQNGKFENQTWKMENGNCKNKIGNYRMKKLEIDIMEHGNWKNNETHGELNMKEWKWKMKLMKLQNEKWKLKMK